MIPRTNASADVGISMLRHQFHEVLGAGGNVGNEFFFADFAPFAPNMGPWADAKHWEVNLNVYDSRLGVQASFYGTYSPTQTNPVLIKVTTAGAPGTAKVKFSMDCGATFGDETLVSSLGNIVYTGADTLTQVADYIVKFAGVLVLNDIYMIPTGAVSYTFANTPFQVLVKCTTLGAPGVSKVQFSIDGGVTYGDETLVPDGSSFALMDGTGKDTGIDICIDNTLGEDDILSVEYRALGALTVFQFTTATGLRKDGTVLAESAYTTRREFGAIKITAAVPVADSIALSYMPAWGQEARIMTTATGDGATKIFYMDIVDDNGVYDELVVPSKTLVLVDGAEKTELTDYTCIYEKAGGKPGTITFTAAPTDTKQIIMCGISAHFQKVRQTITPQEFLASTAIGINLTTNMEEEDEFTGLIQPTGSNLVSSQAAGALASNLRLDKAHLTILKANFAWKVIAIDEKFITIELTPDTSIRKRIMQEWALQADIDKVDGYGSYPGLMLQNWTVTFAKTEYVQCNFDFVGVSEDTSPTSLSKTASGKNPIRMQKSQFTYGSSSVAKGSLPIRRVQSIEVAIPFNTVGDGGSSTSEAVDDSYTPTVIAPVITITAADTDVLQEHREMINATVKRLREIAFGEVPSGASAGNYTYFEVYIPQSDITQAPFEVGGKRDQRSRQLILAAKADTSTSPAGDCIVITVKTDLDFLAL